MQESRLYTGIPKWRERLGIEPSSRFSTGTTVLKTAAGTSRTIIPNNTVDYSGRFNTRYSRPYLSLTRSPSASASSRL